MPCWVGVVYWVVGAVGVQVQGVGLIAFASVGVLGYESAVLRVAQ